MSDAELNMTELHITRTHLHSQLDGKRVEFRIYSLRTFMIWLQFILAAYPKR